MNAQTQKYLYALLSIFMAKNSLHAQIPVCSFVELSTKDHIEQVNFTFDDHDDDDRWLATICIENKAGIKICFDNQTVIAWPGQLNTIEIAPFINHKIIWLNIRDLSGNNAYKKIFSAKKLN